MMTLKRSVWPQSCYFNELTSGAYRQGFRISAANNNSRALANPLLMVMSCSVFSIKSVDKYNSIHFFAYGDYDDQHPAKFD